jgi:hypothetical protein
MSEWVEICKDAVILKSTALETEETHENLNQDSESHAEIRSVYLPNIYIYIVIKSRRMRCAGHVARMGRGKCI